MEIYSLIIICICCLSNTITLLFSMDEDAPIWFYFSFILEIAIIVSIVFQSINLSN